MGWWQNQVGDGKPDSPTRRSFLKAAGAGAMAAAAAEKGAEAKTRQQNSQPLYSTVNLLLFTKVFGVHPKIRQTTPALMLVFRIGLKVESLRLIQCQR